MKSKDEEPKFTGARKLRRRVINVELPDYFKTPEWDDLATKRPLVLIYIKDGDVQDVILRSVEPETVKTVEEPKEAPKAQPEPELADTDKSGGDTDDIPAGFDDLPPSDPDGLPLDTDPVPPDEKEAEEPPKAEAEAEDTDVIRVGTRVEGKHENGDVFRGTILSIEADETEVLMKMDFTNRKEYVSTANLTKILVS